MRGSWAAILPGALVFAFTSAGTSQSTEIRGATIVLLPKTVEIERITIENRRSSPLVAWQLQWTTVAGIVVTHQSDFSWRPLPRRPGAGAILPNERRTIESAPGNTPTAGQAADFCLASAAIAPGRSHESDLGSNVDDVSNLPTLKLSFVLYDDLSFEGSPRARDDLFKRREEQADEMAYANAVRAELTRLTPDQVHGFLMARPAERLRDLVTQGRKPQLHELEEMIEQARRSPERLLEIAPAIIEKVQRQRERLLRHRRSG